MTQVTVRPMRPADVPAALDVWHRSWVEAYVRPDLGVTQAWVDAQWEPRLRPESVDAFTERVAAAEADPPPGGGPLVAERSGAVVGVAAPFVDDEGRQRVGALYVDPGHIGTGVGAALLRVVLDRFGDAHPVHLQVAGYNDRAVAFYERFGFVRVEGSEELEVGTVPDFWMRRPAG